MESQIIETAAGPVEYTLLGHGPLIMAVHGGNDNCYSDIGQEELARLGYRVLIPSRPGYGRTPISLGKSAAEQAGVLKALLTALGVEKAAVIALSAGGPTALEFARLYPESTVCLILEEAVTKTWVSRFSPQYWAMKWIFDPKRQAGFWRGQREQFNRDPKGTMLSLAKMFSLCKPADVIAQWDEADIAAYQAMLYSFDSGSGFIHNIDHKARDLQDIHVPVLIIHSRYDRDVPFSHAEYAHRLIKKSELYEAPALSHLINLGPGKDEILQKRTDYLLKVMPPAAA